MRQSTKVLQVAFTYVGTIVGAGFATGQEILQFFTEYGKWATLTILLSCLLFVWLGTKMMLVAHDTGAKSYEDLNSHLFGKNAGKWISFFTLFVLIGVNSVILAGAGSVFMEHLHLSYQTGLLITLVGTYLLLGRGIHAILQMNSIVVPLMMTLSLFILFHTTGHPGAANFVRLEPDRSMFATWLSPILYSSFNLAMAQAILVPLGSQITDRRVIKYGGILGGIGIGFMLMTAHFAMSAYMPGIKQFEVPMGSIAFALGAAIQLMYIFLIFMEIFSTFVADIYGITLQVREHLKVSPKLITLFIMLSCFLLSQFGFSSLLSILYPIYGTLAVVWVAHLIKSPLGSFKNKDNN